MQSGLQADRHPPDPPARRGRGPWEPEPADPDTDRGAVTVEAALALCGVVLVLALAIGAVAAVGASIRCTDAARELARLGARGEPERARVVAARLAPAGAAVSLSYEGDLVVAEVSAAVLGPLPLRVEGRAVAAAEPGVRAP